MRCGVALSLLQLPCSSAFLVHCQAVDLLLVMWGCWVSRCASVLGMRSMQDASKQVLQLLHCVRCSGQSVTHAAAVALTQPSAVAHWAHLC